MKAALEAIRQKIVVELQEAHDMQTLENIRVKFLGKKGELTAILKQMGRLSAEERPAMGRESGFHIMTIACAGLRVLFILQDISPFDRGKEVCGAE